MWDCMKYVCTTNHLINALTLHPSPQKDAYFKADATKHVISMVEEEVKITNPGFKFKLSGKNQESKFVFAYDKENTRLAGKTLEDWKNCFTAYILRPVQSNPEAATGSVRPTATWEFVKKDGRVMAKYTNKKTSMETQPDRHRCKKRRRTEPTQQTVELVLDPVDPEEREVLNKRLRDENLMTNRVTSEVTKMLYRFCKLNPEFIGTRSDFEAGLKRFSRSPDASQQQLYDRNMQTFVQKRLLKQISSNPVKYQSNL